MKVSRFQIPLSGLMGIVLVVALGCAALRQPSEFGVSAAITALVGALFMGILAALFRRGEARAFWLGFALFGGGYFVIAFGSWQFSENLKRRLLTEKLLDYLHPRIVRPLGEDPTLVTPIVVSGTALPNASVMQNDGTGRLYQTPSGQIVRIAPAWAEFEQIGHALFGLLLALIGGMLARYYFLRSEREGTGQPPAQVLPKSP